MRLFRHLADVNVVPARYDWIIDLLVVLLSPLVIFVEWDDFVSRGSVYRSTGDIMGPMFWTSLYAVFVIGTCWCWFRPAGATDPR